MSILQIKAKLSQRFADLGNKNGTAPLDSTDNRASIAHEFYVADSLRSMANKRYEVAKKAAENAGMLLDDPIAGSTVVTYENEHVSLSAKVASPVKRLDTSKLSSALMKKIGSEEAAKLLDSCYTENKPAVSYSFAAKGEV